MTDTDAARTWIARAPVRVDLFGGGTDAPPYCTAYGGCVVNVGIQPHVHAVLHVRPASARITLRSAGLGEETVTGLDELDPACSRLPLLAALVRHLAPPWGLELDIASDVPPGSGLGSSGAVGTAAVAVLCAALGRAVTQVALAELGNHVERNVMGAPGGSQDSYGAALGGINVIRYTPGADTCAESLTVPAHVPLELERRCVLVYTGEAHLSGSIHADIRTGYADEHGPTRRALCRLHEVGEAGAAALAAGDLDAFAHLLTDNWLAHQQLHPSCNSERLRAFHEAAAPHARGGKTCGAGGGGCVLFLAREGRREALIDVCRALGGRIFPFAIDRTGVVAWRASGR